MIYRNILQVINLKELVRNKLSIKSHRLCFIPVNLNLSEFLTENPPTFKHHLDNFLYILSLITEIPAKNKSILRQDNFVPIKAKELQLKIGSYKKYLDYLLAHKILETDGHYIVGEKCKGFRFSEVYQTEIKPVTIAKSTLLRNTPKPRKRISKINANYPYLEQWFNDGLSFDFNLGIEYLKHQLEYDSKLQVNNALLKYNTCYVNASYLKNRNYYFVVDTFSGRLHTNLTTLKSELRNLITFENHPLVSIDIVNSQPLLSTILFNENFYCSDNCVNSTGHCGFYHYIPSKIDNTHSIINDIYSYIMILKNHESQYCKAFEAYISSVSGGTFYETFQELILVNTGSVINRNAIKEMLFNVLYSDNRFIGQTNAQSKRLFKRIFPEVYKVFSLLKRSDKTLLPRLLQTIESKIILDRIAYRINLEEPQMPLFTIHDSIVCPLGYENVIGQVMRDEIEEVIGVSPKLKYEYWNPNNIVNIN